MEVVEVGGGRLCSYLPAGVEGRGGAGGESSGGAVLCPDCHCERGEFSLTTSVAPQHSSRADCELGRC